MELLGHNNFDVIITDICMEEMDGLLMTKLIRNTKDYDTLPVIAVSALSSSGERRKIFNAQINDFLVKPFDIKELLHRIYQWTVFLTVNSELEFDRDIALARLDNNLQLYEKLWDRFIGKCFECIDIMDDYLGNLQYDPLIKYIHGFKALAGTVGAFDVFKITDIMETRLKEENYRGFNILFNQFMVKIDFYKRSNVFGS